MPLKIARISPLIVFGMQSEPRFYLAGRPETREYQSQPILA
jgi:hypothetical protein